MTDGIIQKVLDKYIKIAKALELNNALQLERIQQELIEEIKKTDRMFYDKTRYRIERWLIGDNQE